MSQTPQERPQQRPQQRPLGAQISHMLKQRGVEVIFGIPGVHNIEMYRGIEDAGITHVLARHEQGAGFMADGYARATGKPGVAYVITGPGLCNIMTPIGQAYSDSVPVLVLSSCLDETAAQRGQLHQMLDQETAAGCVADWSETARTSTAAYTLIDRAFGEFQSQRARPKHIQVPINVLGALADPAPESPGKIVTPQEAGSLSPAAVALLNTARRVVVIAGGGAVSCADTIREFTAKLGAASFVTYAGRGIFGSNDPLHFGAYLARSEAAAILGSADLVVAIGTELAEVDLWRDDLGHQAPLLRIDIDPEVLADRHRADIGILAPAEPTLKALMKAMQRPDMPPAWSPAEVAAARLRFRQDTDAARPGIAAICAALAAGLPDDTMYYSDMTQFAYVAKEVWDMPRPAHWHHPFGFGTLGYALPAAIGGAVARPGLPTLAIAGDYGFQYSLQELGAAVELGLSLPILLWDNAKLKEIEDAMVRAQVAPNAVTAYNPDFLALAQAYGAKAAQPGSLPDLVQQINTGFTAGVPTLIRVTPEILTA